MIAYIRLTSRASPNLEGRMLCSDWLMNHPLFPKDNRLTNKGIAFQSRDVT